MAGKSILLVSPSWIGDAVMSMPAVQLFREDYPETKVTVLAKPGVGALWKMHPAVDRVLRQEKTGATIRQLNAMNFDRAYIFPNSFRSAFLPFMAGIPRRTGARGHWRKLMLSDIVQFGSGHQQFENMNILGVQGEPPAPQIVVPEEAFHTLERKVFHLPGVGKKIPQRFRMPEEQRLTKDQPLITLLPGAARGPSKRWPPDHFVQLAGMLKEKLNALIVFSGGPDDAVACAEMAEEIGPESINLAGETSIPEWAALLRCSDCVAANDSGGMHLATAVGTPVAAVFGVTDPKKTGPLGRHAVLQQSSVQSRNVARHSDEAVRALAAVEPASVFAAVKDLLESSISGA